MLQRDARASSPFRSGACCGCPQDFGTDQMEGDEAKSRVVLVAYTVVGLGLVRSRIRRRYRGKTGEKCQRRRRIDVAMVVAEAQGFRLRFGKWSLAQVEKGLRVGGCLNGGKSVPMVLGEASWSLRRRFMLLEVPLSFRTAPSWCGRANHWHESYLLGACRQQIGRGGGKEGCERV
jgi:hypothetical protein